MAKELSEEEIYELAKQRVKEKREFYGHFGSWVIVNALLVIIWALATPGGYMWFLWPLGIWGFFVLAHFIKTFVFRPKPEKEAIEKEAEKIRKEQGK